MFSGLSWTFPLSEMESYITNHMQLIMPLLLLILGVLLALLVVDGITTSLLKIIGFVAGVPTSGVDMDNDLSGGRRRKRHPLELEEDDPESD